MDYNKLTRYVIPDHVPTAPTSMDVSKYINDSYLPPKDLPHDLNVFMDQIDQEEKEFREKLYHAHMWEYNRLKLRQLLISMQICEIVEDTHVNEL